MTAILDPQRFYHTGVVVTDLHAAIQAFAAHTGLTFEPPSSNTARIRTPDGLREVQFQVSHSAEGPVHLELVQQIPGTLWVTDKPASLHHLGYWSDDLMADAARLEAGGMTLAMAHEPDAADQPSLYRYFRSPLGPFIELVDASLRPYLESGWEKALG